MASSVTAEGDRGRLYVSSVLVRVLCDVLQQRSISPEVLLEGFGRAHTTQLDARLPLAHFQALCVRAVRLTGLPGLGLLCGALAREPSFDIIGPLVAHAPTLRHALELAAQFHPLVLDGGSLQFVDRGDRVHARCDYPRSDPVLDRWLAEFMLAGLHRLLLLYGVRRSDIHAVQVPHARPAHHAAYASVFGGAERFCEPHAALEFSSRLMHRPNLHAHVELDDSLRAQAGVRLNRLSRELTIRERLEVLLRRRPLTESPDMEQVARALGISERSLRRKLEAEGTTYREVAETLRKDAACVMLQNPDVPVQAISHSLGFAHSTAFHRAFKRWLGTTPAQYRELTR